MQAGKKRWGAKLKLLINIYNVPGKVDTGYEATKMTLWSSRSLQSSYVNRDIHIGHTKKTEQCVIKIR